MHKEVSLQNVNLFFFFQRLLLILSYPKFSCRIQPPFQHVPMFPHDKLLDYPSSQFSYNISSFLIIFYEWSYAAVWVFSYAVVHCIASAMHMTYDMEK